MRLLAALIKIVLLTVGPLGAAEPVPHRTEMESYVGPSHLTSSAVPCDLDAANGPHAICFVLEEADAHVHLRVDELSGQQVRLSVGWRFAELPLIRFEEPVCGNEATFVPPEGAQAVTVQVSAFATEVCTVEPLLAGEDADLHHGGVLGTVTFTAFQ